MTSAPVRIAGILLAAGASRRFGAANKLLSKIDGAPLIRRSAEALITSQALAPLIVVVRPGADDVRAALAGLPVLFAVNADADEGIASSIRTGLRSIEDDARAVLIAQADMPNLTARSIAALATAFVARAGNAIVAPRGPSGRIGTPIV
ncbi:MAG: nucleotidyltransferase family protein, partial [Pseudomonadota bacterium]